jgi:HAD superfamily hydrolase (TIGR01509 family)
VQRVGAAIFDFDETMIDLEPQHAAASEELCRSMGSDYEEIPESTRNESGRRIIDDVREMREFFGWQESLERLLARRQELFDDACRRSELRLMPGVERVVRELHARGITLAITSSAVRASIEEILRRLRLFDFFAAIVDGSEVTHGKPDPEAYIVTASRVAVKPEECLVFEDSTVGVQAAKAAGMFCIAIRNPSAQIRQNLSSADLVLDSFQELDVSRFASASKVRSARPRA